jgi:hypothetical protein
MAQGASTEQAIMRSDRHLPPGYRVVRTDD